MKFSTVRRTPPAFSPKGKHVSCEAGLFSREARTLQFGGYEGKKKTRAPPLFVVFFASGTVWHIFGISDSD